MTKALQDASSGSDGGERVRQAAILLRAIGPDQAARAVGGLWPRDAQRLGGAMATLGRVSERQVDEAVGAFLETVGSPHHHGLGASDYLKRLLEEDARSPSVHVRSKPQRGSRALQWMSAAAVARLMRRQPPHIRAMTLAYLDPARAALAVTSATAADRCAILLQLARLRACGGEGPGRGADSASHGGSAVLGGASGVADILCRLSVDVREEVLADLVAADPALAARVMESVSDAQAFETAGAGPHR